MAHGFRQFVRHYQSVHNSSLMSKYGGIRSTARRSSPRHGHGASPTIAGANSKPSKQMFGRGGNALPVNRRKESFTSTLTKGMFSPRTTCAQNVVSPVPHRLRSGLTDGKYTVLGHEPQTSPSAPVAMSVIPSTGVLRGSETICGAARLACEYWRLPIEMLRAR